MKNYDVIVIGGGIMGTACAYYLTREGLKTALVERGDIASGTVSHTDGHIGYSEKQPGIDMLQAYHSMQLYLEMEKEFDYDFEFERDGKGDPAGYIIACETEFEMEEARKHAARVRSQGLEMYAVDSKEFQELEPLIAKDLAGALWIPKDTTVCPHKVAFGFVYEAKKTGLLDVYMRTEVRDILQDPNTKAVQGILTDKGETLRAPHVVNAAGCWSNFIGAMVGIDVPIEPRYGLLTITEKCGKITQNREFIEYGYILAKFLDSSVYQRPVSELVNAYNVCLNISSAPSGNTQVGGCRLFRGYSIKSEYRIMRAVAERAIRFFPMLKNTNCIRSFGGLRPFCLDHLPIVSNVEEVPGFYMAAGHEGSGIALGPITGKLISEYITGKPLYFEEASELAWSRFTPEKIELYRKAEEENTRLLTELERKLYAKDM
ncbi:MAG: FAD-binding oxidoreductase [Firmicutes bacterium]|nr:FAD-binding oxidoreductase [Bacillota bacterium]MBR6700401.1 FAD-binding oxidoreductase [Bacillota bacterium]